MFLVSVLLVATANVLADPVNRQSVLTFNTLLYEGATPAVDNVERRTAIINSIRDIDADVVCLQEVWKADDLEEFTQSLSGVYRHSYSLLHQTGEVSLPSHQTPAACPTCAFHALVNCAIMNGCLSPSGRLGDQTVAVACILQQCLPQFIVLPQKCIGCIILIGFGTDLLGMEAKCAGDPAVGKPNVNDPGLVLLSKTAMDSPTYVDYHPGFPQLLRRGYIHANISGMGDVTCTHLTHMYVTPDYFEVHLMLGGQFTSFEEQSIDEIGKLISFITKSEEPHVVLGDFNTGPASHDSNHDQEHDFVAEYEGQYEMLTDHLETQLVKSCTFCSYNPYVDGYPSVAIDHIFVRNHDRLMKVDRVLDKETVPSSELPLSDHYGVYGTIKWMKPRCASG